MHKLPTTRSERAISKELEITSKAMEMLVELREEGEISKDIAYIVSKGMYKYIQKQKRKLKQIGKERYRSTRVFYVYRKPEQIDNLVLF